MKHSPDLLAHLSKREQSDNRFAAQVVNLALKETVEVGKTLVHFIPYWDLLRKSF